MSNEQSFVIRILFDNRCAKTGFLKGFGFSALVINNFTKNLLLFDTGGNGNTLLQNLKQFDLKADDLNKVVISHRHIDHAGGLEALCAQNSQLKVYVPMSDLNSYKRSYSDVDFYGIVDLEEIEENVISSGQFGTSIREQCLYLKTKDQSIVMLVGCTHPGLENFIVKARELGPIKAIIGGFHGFRKYSYLEDVEVIGACHCTSHMNAIKKRFPENFKEVCVGSVLSF
ncbi:MAG: MBL fold metallo-hydrolase [Candidatus Lokiarchaeota archaeon]|nr:MBL fold metallo-hydrolase [Candidatus Lokiarchaeota archaeon]